LGLPVPLELARSDVSAWAIWDGMYEERKCALKILNVIVHAVIGEKVRLRSGWT